MGSEIMFGMNTRNATVLVAALVVGVGISAGFAGVISASDGTYAQNEISFVAFCADGITESDLTSVEPVLHDGEVVGVSYSSSVELDEIVLKTGQGQNVGSFFVFSNPASSGSVDTSGTAVNGDRTPANPCDSDFVKFERDDATNEFELE